MFLPNIAPDGYVACTSSSDCDPGRACSENVCAPPPWNDDKFEARAVVPTGEERERLYRAQANLMPNFDEYQKKTKRQIPVVVLERV